MDLHIESSREVKRREGNSRKGFASMSPERRSEIARMGGLRAQEKGTAHRWTPDEAKAAGRKGGLKGKPAPAPVVVPVVVEESTGEWK